jgi:23S rRNA (pseudouridine1915-N3)-methyltransferase
MMSLRFVCVGRMREKHYIEAFSEYAKRLGAYCKFETIEVPEVRLSDVLSEKNIAAALEREAAAIEKQILKGAYTVALCKEGERMSSEALAGLIARRQDAGISRLCFIVGGSFGLAQSVKAAADLRLSMSEMTFPHHLARVMLAEQVYRAFGINEGSKYHK